MKRVLAFDMGATSIRGIIGYVKDGKLVTEEVMSIESVLQYNISIKIWTAANANVCQQPFIKKKNKFSLVMQFLSIAIVDFLIDN